MTVNFLNVRHRVDYLNLHQMIGHKLEIKLVEKILKKANERSSLFLFLETWFEKAQTPGKFPPE